MLWAKHHDGMDTATLRTDHLAEDDFPEWSDAATARLAAQRALAGTHGEESAEVTARGILARLLPEGARTSGQHVVAVRDGDARLGVFWLGVAEGGDAFIYDVDGPPHHLPTVLATAEAHAASHGAATVKINVFDHDRALRAATDERGYLPSATQMRLRLPRPGRPNGARHVELLPMTPASFPEFAAANTAAYAEDLVRSRAVIPRDAPRRAQEEFDELLPDGLDTEGQLLFDIVDEGRPRGTLWLEIDGPTAFVCDVAVAASERGKGYGRAAMVAAEDLCGRLGADTVRLSVFGFNDAGRRLYESLGYERVEEIRYREAVSR